MTTGGGDVAINIREGFTKKNYENVFIRHLNDSIGSSEETRGWLDFSERCPYINNETHQRLDKSYDEVNAMLFSLMKNWKTGK
jgi:four helix bundle protein